MPRNGVGDNSNWRSPLGQTGAKGSRDQLRVYGATGAEAVVGASAPTSLARVPTLTAPEGCSLRFSPLLLKMGLVGAAWW